MTWSPKYSLTSFNHSVNQKATSCVLGKPISVELFFHTNLQNNMKISKWLFHFFWLLGPSLLFAQPFQATFKRVSTDEKEVLTQLTEDFTASLYVSVLGRSHNEAFLYGVWGMGPGPLRSVMLRTTNGGKNWREVMQPVGSSEVWEVQFLNAKMGFALVLFTMEGPGPISLFRTLDGGDTWKEQGEVPKSDHSDVPVRMNFSSKQKGELYLTCNAGADEEYLMRQTTTNGGKTWKKGPCLPANTFTLPQHGKQLPKDLTMWELTAQETQSEITLLRYRAIEQQKIPVATIPKKWKVVGDAFKPAQ